MRARQTVVGLGLVLGFAVPAVAQTPCPPDGWFCDDGRTPPAAAPPADEAEAGAPEDVSGEWTTPEPEPAKPQIVVRQRGEAERDEGLSLLERRRARPSSPWGVNLRLEGVLLERRARHEDAALGGLGVSLRYQLLPVVALDLGLDLIAGTDYNGFDRSELMVSTSGLFFFNPHMPVQVYTIAGLNFSAADVQVIYSDGASDDQDWRYFGGHLGLGLQAELSPRLALNFDLTGFLRGRTDSLAEREPEFIDSRGRMTNLSGGALLRAGITFFR